MPDNGARIGRAILEVTGDQVEVVDTAGLGEAVAVAYDWAKDGGVVLLSPAAPSFGRFSDYRARADAFAEAVGRCGTLT
jgi:UDP-N-acetylmuramoylalanine--D-glutamate ligase